MKLAYQLERWRRGRLYGTVASTCNWIKHEVRARPPVPWSRRLACWRPGFFAQLICDLTDGDGPAYLTAFQHLRVNSNIGGRDIFLLESRDRALVRRRGQPAEPFEPAGLRLGRDRRSGRSAGILEANANSDIDLHQIHGGLLADARVRRFYQAVGVV